MEIYITINLKLCKRIQTVSIKCFPNLRNLRKRAGYLVSFQMKSIWNHGANILLATSRCPLKLYIYKKWMIKSYDNFYKSSYSAIYVRNLILSSFSISAPNVASRKRSSVVWTITSRMLNVGLPTISSKLSINWAQFLLNVGR